MGERLVVDGHDEVARVAQGFNRMADELESTIARLRQSESTRARLIEAFAHELATPLTSVVGYLETLRMAEVDADAATRRRSVDTAFAQARALVALAEDLDSLAELDADQPRIARQPCDLAELVAREVAPFELRGAERGVRVFVRGPASLDVVVDAGRIGQVLRNVLDNALRVTTDRAEIHIELRHDNERAVLRIADGGAGLPADELARLGDPLYRRDTSRSRSTGGRGLGLSIAAAIVRAHGGTLTFSSPPGSGLVVEFGLPCLDTSVDESATITTPQDG